jgi:hypothetical protein
MKTIGLMMALCLLGGVSTLAVADNTAQQNKMVECNKQASGLQGDQRKAFMSTCLKKPAASSQQEKMKQCNAAAKGKKGDERIAFMSQCLKKSTG